MRLITLAAAAAVAALFAFSDGTGTSHAATSACAPWQVTTLASGQGVLENLEPDGRGGLLISNNGGNRIDRMTADGHVTPFITGVPSPGGQRIRGRYLYFNTGDSAQAGVLGTNDGTIRRYDLTTGTLTTWASSLYMPNGLLFLPTGDAVVSRDSPGKGITRVRQSDPSHPQYNWVNTNDSNGLAVDPTRTWLYFDQTFQPGNDLMRARISNPSDVEVVKSLGNGLVLDDLTIDRDGVLYIASNRPAPLGEIIRVDPYTKQQCVIASGLADASAVKFGCGPGFSTSSLYAVGFGGDVYRISPPPGAPVPRGTCDAAGASPPH